MTERRDLDPSDRRDAPPDPESGAPVDVPVAVGDETVQRPPGTAVPAATPRPGALSYLLAILLPGVPQLRLGRTGLGFVLLRSEEHTSELQSRENLVCRLL